MLGSSESNLQAEIMQSMHKFTKVASEEKNKFYVSVHTSCKNDKGYEAVKSITYQLNITHKLTKVASEEREEQSLCTCSYNLINTMK